MPGRPTPRGHRGFTLPELVLVLVLIGILAALAIPRMDIGTASDRIAADQVLDAARHARRVARQSGCPVRIRADAATDRFTAAYTGAGGGACPAVPLPDPARGGVLTVDAPIASGGAVVFDARGRTTAGLTIGFETGDVLIVEAGSGHVHR
ncbi:MAG: prepilin-type N-terminal cleavage/methylation domain-containing protein [Wenzhouxiangellaceae bacterium]|nr:prepilin-type N-terminal cleavage/methylation domain-containing protein [Wenzhouxiangellaceae bacterium]